MRAFLCHKYGEPETMKVEEAPPPEMIENGVRVFVEAFLRVAGPTEPG